MKRICHVTSLHPAYDARIFFKECRSLTKHYDVYLIAPNVEDCDKDNIKVRGVVLPEKRLERFLSLNIVYKKMKEIDADLYHFHDPELMKIAYKIKRQGKVVIFDSHEDVPSQILDKPWIPKLLRKPVSKVYSIYEAFYFKRFDGLISVTPNIVNRLFRINQRTVQVTNYPIVYPFEDNRSWDRNVCFIGSISPHYMLDVIISLLDKAEAKMIIAGLPTDHLNDLKKEKNWSLVDFKGFVSHSECLGIIQRCSVGVCLSRYRPNAGYKKGTLGVLKLFEYMMAGIPVVVTDYDLWVDIIERNNCGICVNPNDERAILNAIIFLLDNPEKAKEMGENGRRLVEDAYNWESQEKILFDFYDLLLN